MVGELRYTLTRGGAGKVPVDETRAYPILPLPLPLPQALPRPLPVPLALPLALPLPLTRCPTPSPALALPVT